MIDLDSPQIVAVLNGDDRLVMDQTQAAVRAGADILELRGDLYDGADLSGCLQSLRHNTSLPILLTIRHRAENGRFDGSEDDRLALYHQLLPHVDAIDCEISSGSITRRLFASKEATEVSKIASFHDFSGMPDKETLQKLITGTDSLGADLCKIAVTTETFESLTILMNLLRVVAGPLAVMGMGRYGRLSRALATAGGSNLVYGFVGDDSVVPGQLSVADLRVWLDAALKLPESYEQIVADVDPDHESLISELRQRLTQAA